MAKANSRLAGQGRLLWGGGICAEPRMMNRSQSQGTLIHRSSWHKARRQAGMSSAKPNNRKKEPGGQEWGTECGEDGIRVVGYSKIMKTLSAVATWFILRSSNQSILKEISPWIFIGRTEAEAETPILWPPDAKSWFIWKDPDPGKDSRQEEKEMTEDEMVGWHHWLDGHEGSWWWTGRPGML